MGNGAQALGLGRVESLSMVTGCGIIGRGCPKWAGVVLYSVVLR